MAKGMNSTQIAHTTMASLNKVRGTASADFPTPTESSTKEHSRMDTSLARASTIGQMKNTLVAGYCPKYYWVN